MEPVKYGSYACYGAEGSGIAASSPRRGWPARLTLAEPQKVRASDACPKGVKFRIQFEE